MYACMNLHTYLSMYACIHTHTHMMHVCIIHIHFIMHVCIHTYAYPSIHPSIHTHTHADMQTGRQADRQTQARTHTHSLTLGCIDTDQHQCRIVQTGSERTEHLFPSSLRRTFFSSTGRSSGRSVSVTSAPILATVRPQRPVPAPSSRTRLPSKKFGSNAADANHAEVVRAGARIQEKSVC